MSRPQIVKAFLLGLALAALPAGWPLADAGPAGAPSRGLTVAAQALPAETAYVANEASGTVSVINTAANAIVATICLGSDPAIAGTPQPAGPCNAEADHHKPFYDGHVGTHGLWLTPDGAVLLVANRISGTIVAISTAGCNGLVTAGCPAAVLGYAPVGREPHLATVRPGGREAWVAVRGESYLDVLKLDKDDLTKPGLRPTARMERVASIDTASGPSMVSFTSDGKYAFVAHGKAGVVQKIDAATRQVIASQTVAAPFTPFGLVTPDDQELYLVHKGAGKLSILRTGDLGFVTPPDGLPIGPRANHVYFIGKLAYITIGGPPSVGGSDPEGGIVIVDRATHQIVAASSALGGLLPGVPLYQPQVLAGAIFPGWAGEPHGIWATSDGRRLYVGHERGNRVTVIDTGPNADDPADDRVVGAVTGSAQDLASLKQPIDIVIRR